MVPQRPIVGDQGHKGPRDPERHQDDVEGQSERHLRRAHGTGFTNTMAVSALSVAVTITDPPVGDVKSSHDETWSAFKPGEVPV